jgi:quinol monooxygenase YgiN
MMEFLVIHVIATIEVVPGRRDAVLAEFRRIVPVVQREAGCLEYGPTVDVLSGIASQVPLRDNVVTVIEKWASLDALRAHTTAPHMVDYRSGVKDLVARVQLQILGPA